jgi:Phosphatidylinositol 3- and 4-kinase
MSESEEQQDPQVQRGRRGGLQIGVRRGGVPQNQGGPPPNLPPLPNIPPHGQQVGQQPTIQPVDTIPDDVALWTTQMLRVLGWNSKKVEQGRLNTEIGTMLQAHQNPSPLVAELGQKHGELSQQFALNGVWDSTQEMQASEIKATLAFESMPNQRARLQAGTANPTFWVDGAPDPISGETREYIFKPAMKGSLMGGMPSGGEPAREALAGRVAEQLRVFTGLDLNMPVTNVISVDRTRLADFVGQRGTELEEGGPTIAGSLQQFKPSDGDLRKNLCAQKNHIGAQSCQNVAMLDTIMLNLDRHDGNLLLGKNGSGLIPIDHGLSFPPPQTVRTGVLTENMAAEKNVLLRLPGSYEPFSQASLDGLAELNPELMNAALKAEAVKMGQAHPGTDGTISTESMQISNLSTRFLKKAAPLLPPAVVQIALGVNSKKLLDPGFARDANAWDQFANSVIADYAPKAAALKEFWTMPGDERDAIFRKLAADGLVDGFRPDYAWVVQNIDVVLPYARSAVTPRPPPARPPQPQALNADQTKQAVARVLPKLKLDNKKEDEWVADWQRIRVLGGAPVVEQVMLLPGAQKCRTLAEVLLLVRKYVEDGEKRDRAGKLVAIHNLFPQLPLPEEKPKLDALFTAWDAFTRNGGIQALRRAQQARPNLSPPGDPQAALMMLLAPMPNPAVAALSVRPGTNRVFRIR